MAEEVQENFVQAIECLSKEKKSIVTEWEELARKNISATKGKSSLVIRDHLMAFINQFEMTMRKKSSKKSSHKVKEEMEVGKSHGRERVTVRGYTLDQVIKEYGLLRQVITARLRARGCMDAMVLEVLARQTEDAVMVAASEFSQAMLQAQEKIVGTLTHDMKNALYSNFLLLDMLMGTGNRSKEDLEIFQKLLENLEKADRLTAELLSSLKVEGGSGMKITIEKVDLLDKLFPLVEETKLLLGDRVKIQAPKEPVVGFFDSHAIGRLLENLISNANKHGDGEKAITVDIQQTEKDVVLSVHNCGEPIPKKDLKTIFDYLAKSKTPAKKKGSSWGIGLFIVDTVAKAHEGGVEVKSSKEEGTTFTVILPKREKKLEGDGISVPFN